MKTPKRNDSKHFNKRGPKPYFAKDPLRCDTVLRTGMQCDFEARSESLSASQSQLGQWK